MGLVRIYYLLGYQMIYLLMLIDNDRKFVNLIIIFRNILPK